MTTWLELRRDGESLVQCRIRHVFVAVDTFAKAPIPDWLRDGLSPYQRAADQTP
jgi:acyl-CoA thioesterase FadM